MDENNTTNGEQTPESSGRNSVETTLNETESGAETHIDENGDSAGNDDSGGNVGENAGNDTESGDGESPGTSIEETDGDGEAEKIQLVYIGPSLIYEKLRSSQILSGTEAEIEAFMAPITEKYPEAAHLLVTPDSLPEAMRKVASKNSVLHKYYEDMLAKSRNIRKG